MEVALFDEAALERSRRDRAQHWKEFTRLVGRFGDDAPRRARAPESHSGLPLQPAYFPDDAEDVAAAVTGPGEYPYRRGLLAAQYQLMNWANQPVIGYG
ncbi:MAG: methylmalonyl-CoA mutase family protein, partial [Acidimicrobiia bacterium]